MNNELKEKGYSIVDAPEIDRQPLFDSFDLLPMDNYLQGDFRRRRFSWFTSSPQGLVKLPHKLFYQAEKYEGRPDIYRQYDEIDNSIISHPSFKSIIDCFISATDINMRNTPVEVHQIRILCGNDIQGNPSPEGVHRDGCHYLGIFVIRRDNIVGGENSIHLEQDGDALLEVTLQPGQFIFCDDEKVMHNAKSIMVAEGHSSAFRDIFVLTAGEHRR